jgi:hypothetical protein
VVKPLGYGRLVEVTAAEKKSARLAAQFAARFTHL